MDNEYGLLSKTVALNLDISTSNLRKWSKLIEDEGYQFRKNEQGQRIYYERDQELLEKLKEYLGKERNVEKAVKTVTKQFKEKNNAEMLRADIREKNAKNSEQNALTTDVLKEIINSASREIVEEALSKQQEYYEKLIDKITSRYEETIKETAATNIELQKKLEQTYLLENNPSLNKENELKKRMDLKKEAIKLWEQKPEKERFVKVGLWSKIEDSIKRDDFIEEYITKKLIEHYENKKEDDEKQLGS